MIAFIKGGVTNTAIHSYISLQEFTDLVKSETYKEQIEKVRLASNKTEKNNLKKKLDSVVFGVSFYKKRHSSDIKDATGLICLDFDDVKNLEEVKRNLSLDLYTNLLFTSPSGNGLKLVVKIDTDDFTLAWNQLYWYYKDKYGIEADKSGKDAVRACFVSYDPEIYLNENSATFQVKQEIQPRVKANIELSDLERAKEVAQQIDSEASDITVGYENWINLGLSLASLGEDARSIYHTISARNSNYDAQECDKKFSDFLQNGKMTSPAYFFKIAKDHGIQIGKKNNGETSSTPHSNEYVRYDRKKYRTYIETAKGWTPITEGYLIYIKFQIKDEKGNISWILEVKQLTSTSIYLTVTHEELFDPKALERILGSYKLSFSPNVAQLQSLRKYLFTRTSFPVARALIRYGLDAQSGIFFYSNVGISPEGNVIKPDEHGIVFFNNEYIRLPLWESSKNSPYQYSENRVSFQYWYSLFSTAQTEYRGFITTCFFIFSVYRDICIKNKAFSPILFVTGVANSGKSTAFTSLNYFFGSNGRAMTINLRGKNTEAAVVSKLGSIENGFQFCDEYEPKHPFTALLQSSYDLKAYFKMQYNQNGDYSILELLPQCAIALASNYLPDLPSEAPFFTRLIPLVNNTKNYSDEQKKASKSLSELEEKGITSVLRELWQYRGLIAEHYSKTYDFLYERFQEHLANVELTNNRIVSNVVQLFTAPYILVTNGCLKLSNSSNDLLFFLDHGKKAILTSNDLMKDRSILVDFFGFIQELYEKGSIIEGVHFKFKDETICLNLKRVHNKYKFEFSKYHKFDQYPISFQSLKHELVNALNLSEEQLFTKVRFKKEENISEVDFSRDSLVAEYSLLKQKFEIDFG